MPLWQPVRVVRVVGQRRRGRALGADRARTQPRPDPGRATTPPPVDLPGLSALSDHERDQLLAAEIAVDIHLLSGSLANAGINIADCTPAAAALDAVDSSARVRYAIGPDAERALAE